MGVVGRAAVLVCVAGALRAPARRCEGAARRVPPSCAAPMIGEGVLPEGVPVEAAPLNAGGVFAVVAVVAAAAAVFLGRNLEANPEARALAGLEAPPLFSEAEPYYIVRWRVARTTVYEGLDSSAAVAEGGADNSVRCESLMEANALTRRLSKQLPGLATRTFKISGAAVTPLGPSGGADPAAASAAEDEWVGDFSDVVRNAANANDQGEDLRRRPPIPPQQVWDDMLQAEAEAEAEQARTDVDRAWSDYLASLRVTEELDVTVIGEGGLAPCRLCNGKGVRVLFKKEVPCEWCDGSGVAQDG